MLKKEQLAKNKASGKSSELFGWLLSVGKIKFFTAAIVILLVTVAMKVLYLKTAESAFNSEELPLASMSLVSDSGAVTNVGVTRLYGTSYITSAISLEILGFNAAGLKAPNVAFFFLFLVALYILVNRQFSRVSQWYALAAVFMLSMGPPVIQMWGMKNRGGFVENLFALALCLWLLATSRNLDPSDSRRFLMGLIVGLAVWSQPIGLVWGLVIFFVLAYQDVVQSVAKSIAGAAKFVSGFSLGVMPLVALNFLYNFNTFRVLSEGEVPGGVDLGYFGRAVEIFTGGLPRLLGLKEQWSQAWLLPVEASWLLYGLFLTPIIYACGRISWDFIRSRTVSLGLVLVGIFVAVAAANVVSSWGNFQLEPRRLLLLYVPIIFLAIYGLQKYPKILAMYVIVWATFSGWANYHYIKKNSTGYAHPVYRSLGTVSDFLADNSIKGVYTDVWTGSRITFEADGLIPWYRFSYLPTNYGYVGDDILASDEAAVFDVYNSYNTSLYEKFRKDLAYAGINCAEHSINSIRIVYGCDQNFAFVDLSSGKLSWADVRGFLQRDATAEDVFTQVGTRKQGALIATGKPGFLMYGPYVTLQPGFYRLDLNGKSSGAFVVDLVASKGQQTLFKQSIFNPVGEDGVLASVAFEVPASVSDFEVRVIVPEGADTMISDYTLAKVQQ